MTVLALLCGTALFAEWFRPTAPGAWWGLSAGLGLGSRAGAAGGFFAWDARLEPDRDGDLGAPPGTSVGEGAWGALEFSPSPPGLRRP
jgi:hypothetical protein